MQSIVSSWELLVFVLFIFVACVSFTTGGDVTVDDSKHDSIQKRADQFLDEEAYIDELRYQLWESVKNELVKEDYDDVDDRSFSMTTASQPHKDVKDTKKSSSVSTTTSELSHRLVNRARQALYGEGVYNEPTSGPTGCDDTTEPFLELWNADTDVLIGPLGDSIDLCAYGGASLSISTTPDCLDHIKYKVFNLENEKRIYKKTESRAPFFLGGNNGDDAKPVALLQKAGLYELEVDPRVGVTTNTVFVVVDCSVSDTLGPTPSGTVGIMPIIPEPTSSPIALSAGPTPSPTSSPIAMSAGPTPDPTPRPSTLVSLALPFGAAAGDKYTVPDDDGSGEKIDLAINMPFFTGRFANSKVFSVVQSVNGYLQFAKYAKLPSADGVVLPDDDLPAMIAPYWTDMDITNGGDLWIRATRDAADLTAADAIINDAEGGSGSFASLAAVVATWYNVGYCCSPEYSGEQNTFQIVVAYTRSVVWLIFSYGKLEFYDKDSGDGLAIVGTNGILNTGETFYEIDSEEKVMDLLSGTNCNRPGTYAYHVR